MLKFALRVVRPSWRINNDGEERMNEWEIIKNVLGYECKSESVCCEC